MHTGHLSLIGPRARGPMQARGLLSHQFRLRREHDKSVAFMPKARGVTLQTTKKGGQKAALLTTLNAAYFGLCAIDRVLARTRHEQQQQAANDADVLIEVDHIHVLLHGGLRPEMMADQRGA